MEDTDIIGASLNNVLRACQQRLPEKDLLAFGALKTDFKRVEFALKQDFVHEIIDFEAGFEGKCLEKAKEFKADGNKFFGKKSYASALDSYNKAVLQVPMYDESGERSEDLSVMIANRWGQPVWAGSTLYSEGSFVRRFFSPKPFEVAMVRRTYGPKVLYSEVPLLRKLLCSEDSIFRKALHYMDSMLRRFFSPKFI